VRVLVVGSGGREHALAWKIAASPRVSQLLAAPGSDGMQGLAACRREVAADDVPAQVALARSERVDLVVVGPEAPLAAGLVDRLREAGIAAFGPSAAAARLESSKAFAKRQMERAGIATAASATFTDAEAAIAHVRAADRAPVVKADWLAAGKGVVVPETHEEAIAAIGELFGGVAPGARLVLEERLAGPEVSVFALISGSTVVPLAAARDYKRLSDGDHGPNTGGMGAYTPVPGFGAAELEDTAADVFEPIAWRMARDGFPYAGVLYAGLMLTADGPMVLEFNARFGDPEAQVLLPMLDGDLAPALLGVATADRALMEGSLAVRPGAAVGVVVASEGYPEAPITGRRITGAEPASSSDDGDRLIFHAGTRRTADSYESTGGRVLTIVGRGADHAAARERAYAAVAEVSLDGGGYRADIAAGLEVVGA
jgi:phosphoribosylamine--glycine ligase